MTELSGRPARPPRRPDDRVGTSALPYNPDMATPPTPVSATVAVAVLTYRREQAIVALLPELARQARLVEPPAAVVVVDNDPEASARDRITALGLPEVRYVHEPRPGIAAARNAGMDAAGDVDLLVFIDDDETPSERWLPLMLDAYRRLGGAAVAGRVIRSYEVEPEPWVRAARVFDRRQMPTGTVVEAASTANLLLDMHVVRDLGLRFDDSLGISGGSDHLFTRQLSASGHRIHWCDEAVVEDPVPASRLTSHWTLQRGYRSGNTSIIVDRLLAPTPGARAKVRTRAAVGGAARVVAGGGRALVGMLTRSSDNRGKGMWTVVRGAGMVGGAIGHHYVEYRRG